MSAEAAVHGGAGKVSLAVPNGVRPIVQSKCIPEVMVLPLENIGSTNLQSYDVVAVGPGLGRTDEAKSIGKFFVRTTIGTYGYRC